MELKTQGEHYKLLPAGNYQAVFSRYEIRTFFGKQKIYVHFSVTDGPFLGTQIFRAYNYCVPLSPGCDLYKDLARLLGRRPKRKERLSLSLFKNRVLYVRLRTVTQNRKQDSLESFLQYSVVDAILPSIPVLIPEPKPIPSIPRQPTGITTSSCDELGKASEPTCQLVGSDLPRSDPATSVDRS